MINTKDLSGFLDYVLSEPGTRLADFRVSPHATVTGYAKQNRLPWSDQDIDLIATILLQSGRIATTHSVSQSLRAAARIREAVETMERAFRLMVTLHNVMFYLGAALVISAIVVAFGGQTSTALILGGVGLSDLAFLLIREPVEGIEENMGDLMQLQAAYNSFYVQLDQWQLYYDYQSSEEDLPVKRRAATEIIAYTRATLDMIRRYCRPRSASVAEGSSAGTRE